MYLDLHTAVSTKQPKPDAPSPVKETAEMLAALLPGCSITVTTLNGETVGFFQGSSTVFSPEELAKRVASQGVVVRQFNDKQASVETLSDLFLTKTLACREASFKGFEHLTPSFMAAFAKARPNLCQLDLRKTRETYLLIQAFLEGLKAEHALAKKRISELMVEKQKKEEGTDLEKIEGEIGECRARIGTVEANGIVIRVGKSDLTQIQKKELHLRYPFAAFEDSEETALDLSRNEESSSESPLTFKQIAFKAQHLPKLQSIDLSGYRGCFCPFSLLALEKKRSIHIQYEAAAKLIAPKSIEVDGATRAPTCEEVSAVLQRFYQEPVDVDLRQVAALSPFDILYLEEKFSKMTFNTATPVSCTLPLSYMTLIEPLCTRFPDLQIELTHSSAKQEIELLSLLDLFPTVQFLNASRVAHLLEDLDLLKSYLKRSLRKNLTTNLSDEELSKLRDQSEPLRTLISKILAYRAGTGSSSLVSLNREIDAIHLRTNQPMTQQPRPPLSPVLRALLVKHGVMQIDQEAAKEPLPLSNSVTSILPPVERSGLLKLSSETALNLPIRSTSLPGLSAPPKLFQSQELCRAVWEGNIKEVESLLNRGADPTNSETEYSMIYSTMNHCLNLAGINAWGKKGLRPLHIAVAKGDTKIIELLLAKGADPLVTDETGTQPRSFPSRAHNVEIPYLLTYCFYLFPAQQERLSLNPSLVIPYIKSVNPGHLPRTIGLTNQMLTEQFLEVAARRGDLEVVKLFLADTGFIANLSQRGKQAALLSATQHNNAKIAKLLFDLNFELPQSYLDSALLTSAEKGNIEIVALLIEKGANVNSIMPSGSPLCLALKNGFDSVAEFLISQGADVNERTDSTSGGKLQPINDKPLHFAVLNGNLKLVEFMIAKGADTNAQGKEGRRPLYTALEKGQESIVELLIAKGAHVNKLSGPDNPFNKNSEEDRPLHLAVQLGKPKLVELLISRGAHLDARSQKIETALNMAILKRDTDVAKLLIEKGANVNIPCRGGACSLLAAMQVGMDEVAELLIEKGANVHADAGNGQKLIHFAAGCSSPKVVELLLKKGAKQDSADWEGNQPLHIAINRGIAKIVDILLANGANVNACGGGGRKPLDLATQRNNPEVIKLLSK